MCNVVLMAYVMQCGVMRCDVVSCDVVWCGVMGCDVVSCDEIQLRHHIANAQHPALAKLVFVVGSLLFPRLNLHPHSNTQSEHERTL